MLAIAVCGLWPSATLAAPGELDPSFGEAGVVRTHIGAADSFDRSDAMVLDESGRTVVVGTTSTPIGESELVIARYLSDGSLDASFGTGGIVKSSAGVPHAVALDAKGNIVVAGQFNGGVMVARFLPTGAPDTSFGGDGVVTTDFTSESDRAVAVAIDGSGRIVIAGGASFSHVLVARYLENGDLDTSFGGGDGYFAETMNDPTTGFRFSGIADMALDANERIVAVGGGFVAMRFTASGALDTSFGGGDGIVGHRVESDDTASAVAIDSSGRILVAGSTGSNASETVSAFDVGVVRYSESGTLDTAFGDGESMAVAPDMGGYESAQGIAVDANGRIVTGGATYDGSTSDFFVARFLPSGRISGSFGGGDGVVTTDLGGDEFGTAVALDSSGRIVLGGNAEAIENESGISSDFALLRYEGGPVVDVFHDLDVQRAGEGEGTVTGLGIDCGTTCTATYDEGTVVTLTATPADDLSPVPSTFTGWSGDCAGEAKTCQVTMDAVRSVTATFEPESLSGEEEPPGEEPPAEPPASPPTSVLPTALPTPAPPTTKLRKAAIRPANGVATFAFAGSGGASSISFQCQLDGASFKPCRSPKTYRGLKSGVHVFRVRAKDALGQTDQSPAVRRFRIPNR